MWCSWHLTRSHDPCLTDEFEINTHLLWLKYDQGKKAKGNESARVKERGLVEGGEESGGVKCWNMNYRPEQHHLDRENTHHSGEPAHWIRLATGSICTSWNQSHSLIWLGQSHRRKRKLLCSFIKLVLFCAPPHSPTFGMLCILMSFGPTGRVMTVVEVNAKKSPSI